jgi:uncharacterized membrane protein
VHLARASSALAGCVFIVLGLLKVGHPHQLEFLVPAWAYYGSAAIELVCGLSLLLAVRKVSMLAGIVLSGGMLIL